MFWSKKKKEKLVNKHSKEIGIVPPANRANTLFLRRSVLDWKDKHVTQIEMHLRRELPVLMNAIDKELNKLSIYESLFKFRKLRSEIIQPLFNEWVSRESTQLLEDAQKELLSIHGLVLDQIDHRGGNIKTKDSKASLLDLATGAAAGVGGIALIPVFTSASVVSTGGILGLLGATTVSLPIVTIGVLVVGSSLALGVHRMSDVKKRAVKSYRKKIHKSINDLVLGGAEDAKPSLCDQLQGRILTASNHIISEIKD